MASEGRWVEVGGPAHALSVHRVVDHADLAPRLRIFALQLRRDAAGRDDDVLRAAIDPGFQRLVKTVIQPAEPLPGAGPGMAGSLQPEIGAVAAMGVGDVAAAETRQEEHTSELQ